MNPKRSDGATRGVSISYGWRPVGPPRRLHPARNCTANKSQITNALSTSYADIPCRISPFAKKMSNSLQPKPSKCSI